jgi:hypothetical protein
MVILIDSTRQQQVLTNNYHLIIENKPIDNNYLVLIQLFLISGIGYRLADLYRMGVAVLRNAVLHFVQMPYHIIQIAHVKIMTAFTLHIMMPFMVSYVL